MTAAADARRPDASEPDRRELFVYYRVRAADAATAARAADAAKRMQAALRAAHPGLVARLLRRPKAADGAETWMEAYSLPGRGIDAAIEARIAADAALALAPWLAGERHVEVFVAVEPPPVSNL